MEKTERLCKVASPFQVVKPLVSTNRFRLLRPDDDRDARTSRTEEQLRATARQQEAVAHLGQQALAGVPVEDLEQAAVALVARILDVEFASVLEFRPESRTLLLRAGVGWGEGSVGRAVVPADADSHAGYVLRSSGAVVVEDLASDTRFGSAPLLAQHGVASSLSVVVHGKERPFGVLGVHTARRREFTIHDTHFLQAVANVLATTVDRARTEAALRQSEEHFRSLIENASDIVTIVGENGVFRYASPSVERVLGYKPGDLLERNAFDFVHPDDIPAVAEALSRAIHRPGSPQAAQLRFRANDGAWRLLETVGQARLTDAGTAQLIVNARDVTERRRQERALRENKARLRTVIAGAPLVLFALDREAVFTMVEGKGLDALGVRPAQLVGRPVSELYADVPQAEADVSRALAGDTFSSTVEVYGVVFDIWYTPIREANGEVSGVIGVANDITERRRFEEALRRSEESSRAPVQPATYGVYRSTLDGRLLAVNPALVRVLGYDSEEQPLAANLARDVYADAAERGRRLGPVRGADAAEGGGGSPPPRRAGGGGGGPGGRVVGEGPPGFPPPLEPRPPAHASGRSGGRSPGLPAPHPARRRRDRDRRGGRPPRGARRHSRRRADPVQPRHQRARRDARRRRAAHRDRARASGGGAVPGVRRAAPRRLRVPRGGRHRDGDGRGDAPPHVRAVLHHQAARPGHRPRARHGVRAREAARRRHRGGERAGEGDAVPHLLPRRGRRGGGRGAGRGAAGGRPARVGDHSRRGGRRPAAPLGEAHPRGCGLSGPHRRRRARGARRAAAGRGGTARVLRPGDAATGRAGPVRRGAPRRPHGSLPVRERLLGSQRPRCGGPRPLRAAAAQTLDRAGPAGPRAATPRPAVAGHPSSTSLTFRASVSGTKGFCRNATPAESTPCRTIASSVYPDV